MNGKMMACIDEPRDTVNTYDLNTIYRRVDHALASGANRIAAFDADGTLWRQDLGDSFFQYTIRNHLIPGLPSDPLTYYSDLLQAAGHAAAYIWRAQILNGMSLEMVKGWAKESLALSPPEVFPEVKRLIAYLRGQGVDVYIVTASVQWAIEPAASLFGLSSDKVIGVKTKVVNGLISIEPDGPIPYKQGKVEALMNLTSGARPFFAAGNTTGDYDMLLSSTHISMVHGSANADEHNFTDERSMVERAKRFGWIVVDRVSSLK